jgi:hypothetical protein
VSVRRRAARAWAKYWFREDAALNLAVARVLAAGVALWILSSRDFAAVSDLPPVFWEGVAASERWRFLVFPGHASLEAGLLWTARGTALLALVGIAPRAACLATGVLLYHIAPLDGIVWTTSPYGRGLTLPLLALLLCAAAPSNHALALGRGEPVSSRSWQYGWALRLLHVFLAQVYLFAGLAKLRSDGLEWFGAENVRNWLLLATQDEGVAVHQWLGAWLASSDTRAGLVGVGTLLFELGFVFALLRTRLRPWLAVAAIGFHAGIYFSINITFNSWPLLLVFFDWDAIRARIRRRLT